MTTTQSPTPAASDAAIANGEKFAYWLAREMPPGTVIGNPYWWAPRIVRALNSLTSKAEAPREVVDYNYNGDPIYSTPPAQVAGSGPRTNEGTNAQAVVSRGNVFDEELLELGEIVRCQTNIWDQVIIVYKDDFNQETWVKEHSVMKL